MDVAQEAYDKAVELFEKKYTNDEAKARRVKGVHGICDVLGIVAEAQAKYQGRVEESKVRRWLGALSSRVMYYGQIMDVMSQHHPEYVSLAWGTMKFLFVLVLNHEEMISELAKAVSKVADVLPRVKLQLETFQTAWMKEAAQVVYADIINFLVCGLQWYEQSPWKHTWKSFKDPYKLRFQDLREKIDEGARRMDDMANTLSHARISEMHQILVRMESKISAHHLIYISRFTGLGQSIYQVQVAQILDATKDTPFPSPIDNLRFCRAMRKNTAGRFELDQSTLLPKLQEWSAAPSSSLIILGGSGPTRFQTKNLASEMVEFIEAADKPVIWALKGRCLPEANEETHINLLKQLTNQVVQLNNKRMVEHMSTNFNAPRVESARTEADWLELLKEGLTGLSEVYVVIDMEVLGQTFEENGESWLEFFRHFETLLRNVQGVAVKVAVLSFRQDSIRCLDTTSRQISLVPLRSVNIRGAGSGVRKSQPWRRKKGKLIQFS